MRRPVVLLLAIGLAVAAGVAPMVAMTHLSRQRAIEGERAHLAEYAGWTLQRATRTLSPAQAP